MPGTSRFPGLDWTFDGSNPLTVAEAFGHAWVQQQAGGSVTLIGADVLHPWWPVLRAWLPAAAPLRSLARDSATRGSAAGDSVMGALDALPQRPFPPIHLALLPRSGTPPWGLHGQVEVGLQWVAEREPAVLIATELPHPAIAVALAAIASWGRRVCWRVADTTKITDVLGYIGQRQLPLHLVVEVPPAHVPEGWMTVGHHEFALWVQHEWPTIYVPTALK